MSTFSIEGNWIGSLSYDEPYPIEIRRRGLAFQINIISNNGVIEGLCEDDITKRHLLQPAIIHGTFKGNSVAFIKTYHCLIELDENLKTVVMKEQPSNEIHYKGRVRRRFFSRKKYIKGKWTIYGSYLDLKYSVGGKFRMQKVD